MQQTVSFHHCAPTAATPQGFSSYSGDATYERQSCASDISEVFQILTRRNDDNDDDDNDDENKHVPICQVATCPRGT